MIRKIIFSNFYSFKKKQEINFIAHKKQTYSYFNSFNGDQISKIAGFIGKNASGKTNISRLFSFLGYFVCFYDIDKNKKFPYKTFFNNTEKSNFEVEFEIENIIYYYAFVLKKDCVLSESLYFKEKNKRKRCVFIREGDEIKKLTSEIKGITKDNQKNLQKNISYIGFINSRYANIKYFSKIFSFFSSFVGNINELGDKYIGELQFIKYNNYLHNKDLKKEVEILLNKFDTGVKGFRIEKDKVIPNTLHIYTKHGYKDLEIGFKYESTGTRHLLLMLGDIILGLKYNKVIILDEMDSFLHSEIFVQLIDFFLNSNEKGSAQLIFTGHDDDFMNYLDMHQNFIVDKKDDKSSVLRLNNIEGIRSDQNFSIKYATGSYGSFPKVRL